MSKILHSIEIIDTTVERDSEETIRNIVLPLDKGPYNLDGVIRNYVDIYNLDITEDFDELSEKAPIASYVAFDLPQNQLEMNIYTNYDNDGVTDICIIEKPGIEIWITYSIDEKTYRESFYTKYELCKMSMTTIQSNYGDDGEQGFKIDYFDNLNYLDIQLSQQGLGKDKESVIGFVLVLKEDFNAE